jgi:hypothetical protein
MRYTEVDDTTYVELTDDEQRELEESGTISILVGGVNTRYMKLGTPPKPKPVIEQGDTVRHNHPECIDTDCKVGYMLYGEEKTCLENSMGCNECIVPMDKLTLIRKGPKVHRFEGVTIEPWDCGVPMALIKDKKERVLNRFSQDGKTYDMTLTERNDG